MTQKCKSQRLPKRQRNLLLCGIAVCALSFTPFSHTMANPIGGNVIGGNAIGNMILMVNSPNGV